MALTELLSVGWARMRVCPAMISVMTQNRQVGRLSGCHAGQLSYMWRPRYRLRCGARRKARRLLADPRVATVAVEHRDRLGRMNTELVKAALAADGRLVVLDSGEATDDLVRDVVEVLTGFCAPVPAPFGA
jgi:putative resolvase